MATGTGGRLWQALVVLGLALTLPLVDANREHKVHNIVLYPNKQSWCTTRNISQVIAEPGCRQVTIDNNVCVGACFSYSIPHTEPSDPGEIIGPYCDSCQPSEVSYVSVKVDCTENPNGKTPYLSKHIQLIHNCSCTACEEQSKRRPALAETGDQSQETSASGEQPVHHPMVQQQHHQKHEEQQPAPQHQQQQQQQQHHHQPQQQQEQPQAQLQSQSAEDRSDPTHSDTIQDDIPEILEVVHYSENDTEPIRLTPLHDFQSHTGGTTYLQQQQLNHYEHNSHTDNVKRLLHQKITKLLRSIKATNSPADREQLVEMIRLIKGTSDRNWDELVVSLQSENSILDFNRLRTELVEEPEEEPAGLVSGIDNAADAAAAAGAAAATVAVADSTNTLPASSEEEPIPDLSASATKKSDSIDDVAVAGTAAAGENDHRRLMQHQFDAVRHRAAQPAPAEPAAREDHGHASPQQQQQQQQQHLHQHQHHTVGERIDAHHHLARGPHGALVIRADAADQEELRSHQNGHEVQEKINIHAHELKPNLAGLVVTYDHHRGERHHHHHQHHQLTTGGLEGAGLGSAAGTEQQGPPAEHQGSEHRSHPHHTQHQHHQAHGYHPHGPHHGHHRETGHQHHGSQAAPPGNEALSPTSPPAASTGEAQRK
ncbi:ecdysone-induced protein 74EF-like [Anopheles cruzii]|uniref:ecdysone-induced protein 74EF-like n=1 Tax=Anopheles cruzii TaxID=68878 RepID=UPI0022EC5464|nr:ecdysone-induced protein 74EF-like [Anopheles cruzii]XP_052867555.1 ecdysone-induced protein 74EF-like [Anopheles cruzii]